MVRVLKWIEWRSKIMTVNITPLHDRVLVRRLEEKETAKGGIIIPDTAKEKPHEGEVMAIGAGKIEKGHRIPLDVKVGDRILFGKYTGNDINIDRKSTRLNSSHVEISYAVFCL